MEVQLKGAAAALLGWMRNSALPLWADAGFDREHGRFEERLTLDATPLPDVPIRLMSQARQIYVYALATRRGWYPDAVGLLEQAYQSMRRDFSGRDRDDGWIFSIKRDGTVVDARRDLYAHAFVLLAIASYVDATGRRDALSLADRTLAYIDHRMAAPRGGGFLDSLPPIDGLRRQNPHMHMFEGLLALWDCSRDAKYLARAAELFELFAVKFFQSDTGSLCEYFTASLDPAVGINGKRVEPGHHYEWIWLLRRFERASGRSVQAVVDALYHHANQHGYDQDGLVVDEILADGSHHVRSRRTWPITEGIKANVVEAKRGREGADRKAVLLAAALLRRFLVSEPSGGWMDRFDAKGNPSIDFMPASTFYHVACAIDELWRFSNDGAHVRLATRPEE